MTALLQPRPFSSFAGLSLPSSALSSSISIPSVALSSSLSQPLPAWGSRYALGPALPTVATVQLQIAQQNDSDARPDELVVEDVEGYDVPQRAPPAALPTQPTVTMERAQSVARSKMTEWVAEYKRLQKKYAVVLSFYLALNYF